MRKVFFTLAMALAATVLAASPGLALWNINVLTNNWKSHVLIGVPFGIGTNSDVAGKLQPRGDLVLSIPGQGDVIFTDKGHNTPCEYPHWGVSINYNDQEWGFFYDGGGRINVTVNEDGTVSFAASSENSQVIKGSGPPKCR